MFALLLSLIQWPFPRSLRGKKITGKNVVIDGLNFSGAELYQCKLIFYGFKFPNISDCKVIECTFVFRGPAAKGLKLLKALEGVIPGMIEGTFKD